MPLAGTVNARREAIVRLTIHGPAASETLDASIDTGYGGNLLVPAGMAARLRLPVVGRVRARLADGTVVRLGVALAAVDWLSTQRHLRVEIGLSAEILLGTAPLAAHRLLIDYLAGLVEVT